VITQKPTNRETIPSPVPNVPNGKAFPVRLISGPKKRWWLIAIGIILAIAAIWAIVRAMNSSGSAPRYLTAPVAYADINASVEESGTVNPVNEVNVGTQVSGTINGLSVDFNSIVRKGQVLATLDPTSLQAAAAQAHGTLAAAQSGAGAAMSTASQTQAAAQAATANARQAAANAQSASANLSKARAQLALSDLTVSRDQSLLSQGFISRSQMDTDLAANRANAADVNAAQSALLSAQALAAAATAQIAAAGDQHAASVQQAAAASAQAQAVQGQVQQADYNLARAVITSPIDGIVVSRNVSIGQTVAASFQTPTLFVIASSLKDMQVDTSVSEADVGQLATGAPAQIAVPAYPNVVFRGTVSQIRVNPTTVQNVVTYDAIVAVHDASARLKPGMTADVTIAVDARKHVLVIPAAALLYRPASGSGSSSGGSAGQGGGASSSASSQPVAGAPGSKVVVWVVRGGKAVSVPIVVGLSDGRNYEVRSGNLKAQDKVITGQLLTHQYSGANPIGGGPGLGR
jgi:HlyD family secretion protein